MPRQVGQNFTVNANAGALHSVKQRRQGQFDLAIDTVEIFFINFFTQRRRDLSGQVSDFGRLPRGFIPAIVSRAAAVNAAKLARQIVQFIFAARGIDDVSRDQSVIIIPGQLNAEWR